MTTSDELQQGRERLAECEKTVNRWRDKAAADRKEADDLEAEAGRRVLADPDSIGTVQARISELRQSATIADLAVVAAVDQVQGVRQDLLKSAAGCVLARAQELRATADKEEGLVGELLELIRDLTGSEYAPVVEVREGLSGIVRREIGASRSDRWRDEANQLERFAVEMNKAAKSPPINETVLDQLLRKADPDGPEAQAAAEKKADAQRVLEELKATQQADREARDEWIKQRTADLKGSHWSETRAEDYARLEFRNVAREHGSVRAALDALAESPLDAPLMA